MILMGILQYLEEKLVLCHFVHCISHVDWPGIKPNPPHGEMSNQLPVPWYSFVKNEMRNLRATFFSAIYCKEWLWEFVITVMA
jgi:hypothetical protein